MPLNNTSNFPGIFKNGGCKLANCIFSVTGLATFPDDYFN